MAGADALVGTVEYRAIAWPNVPCTKLSHCLLIVIDC